MKRSGIGLADIADWHNLAAAFWQASRGKTARVDVAAFRAVLDRQLASLGRDILDGTVRWVRCGRFASEIRSRG